MKYIDNCCTANIMGPSLDQIAEYDSVVPQEADGLVYAYILIWVAKSCGRRSTGFEGVFLDFYIYISQK